MKPFNLAESRIAQRTYCQTHLNRRIRVIGSLAAVAVVVVMLWYGANRLIVARAKKAQGELANIQRRCEDIRKQTSSAQARLDQRQWQDQLAKTSNSWLMVLNSVLERLPEDVWVTRVETSPKDSTLQIDGRAASYDALSAFIASLHRDSAFSDLRLGSVRIVRIGELTCIDFQVPIKLKLKPAGSETAPTAQANAPASGGTGA